MKLIRDDNNLFFFNDTATTEIYTLSLHDALPILIFAPGYDEDALEVLQQKKNVRILDNQERRDWPISEHDIKRVRGGILIQDRDQDIELRDEMQVVTQRKPSEIGRASCRERV